MKKIAGLNVTLSIAVLVGVFFAGASLAQQTNKKQEPPVVNPGPVGGPPADAIVLFDGNDLSKFRGQHSAEPKWNLGDGYMETTPHGGIFSKEEFADCQLHIEWASPSKVEGNDQGRGNSGVYFMGRYEIQILDSYNNKTYPDGQCGAFYGHYPVGSKNSAELQVLDFQRIKSSFLKLLQPTFSRLTT